MTSPHFNVADFGAIGDGVSKDTHAIQKAIDTCHDAGGGKVLLPAGHYLCGTLYLKSNVELHLESGATILGSPDLEDYNEENVFPENWAATHEHVTGRHLIIAYRQEIYPSPDRELSMDNRLNSSNRCPQNIRHLSQQDR